VNYAATAFSIAHLWPVHSDGLLVYAAPASPCRLDCQCLIFVDLWHHRPSDYPSPTRGLASPGAVPSRPVPSRPGPVRPVPVPADEMIEVDLPTPLSKTDLAPIPTTDHWGMHERRRQCSSVSPTVCCCRPRRNEHSVLLYIMLVGSALYLSSLQYTRGQHQLSVKRRSA